MEDRWYRDKRLLREAREQYGSIESAVHAIGGCHVSTAQKAWRDMGLEKLSRGPGPKGKPNREALEALHRKVYG